MARERTFNSFSDFFANANVDFRREVEVAVHNDENIANNRLFVWNFEEVDLQEFIEYFELFKGVPVNVSTRTALSGNLMRKMNSLIREGYNPVECMLYASKTINMRLQNDAELQASLAERIKDVYLKQEAETIAVLQNIIKMWTWVPQIKVVIHAIGLIGDNQELLDQIMVNYAEDYNYKRKVVLALLENKSIANLERVLQIIMNLQDTEEDGVIGRIFKNSIAGFGFEGIKLLGKYHDNPGISRAGSRLLRTIMLKEGAITDSTESDDLHRKNLANKSLRDDLAFKDFREECYEKYDSDAFFLARFSRPEIGDFLKDVIEDNGVSTFNKNTAIVSLGIIGSKGYHPAAAILSHCENAGMNEYAVTIAHITLGYSDYAERLVDYMCRKKDFELSELYRVLRSSGIANNKSASALIRTALEKRFRNLFATSDFAALECLTSNFQMFWDKKLWSLFSWNILDDMREVLAIYSNNEISIPAEIIIAIMETVVHNWNADVEKAIFALYNNAEDTRVRELSYKKLKERKLEAPK